MIDWKGLGLQFVSVLLGSSIRNIIFRLADSPSTSRYVATGMMYYFDMLPENVRNELLLKIADNKETAASVAYAVSKNLDKIPESIRNEISRKSKRENSKENSNRNGT